MFLPDKKKIKLRDFTWHFVLIIQNVMRVAKTVDLNVLTIEENTKANYMMWCMC